MKYLITYNESVGNTSVRSKMTPKHIDDDTVKRMVRRTPIGSKLNLIVKNELLNYFTKEEIRGIVNDSVHGVWLLMDNGTINDYFTKEEIPQLIAGFPTNKKMIYSILYDYPEQLKNAIREYSDKGFLVDSLIRAVRSKRHNAIKILSDTPQIRSHIPDELLKRINTHIDNDTYEELKKYEINKTSITTTGKDGVPIIKYMDKFGPLGETEDFM